MYPRKSYTAILKIDAILNTGVRTLVIKVILKIDGEKLMMNAFQDSSQDPKRRQCQWNGESEQGSS